MLQRALKKGVRADYVLFDRWFTSPNFLRAIRFLGLYAIGRLKNDNVCYLYQGRWLTVAQLYCLIKSDLVWNRELQHALATVAVTCINGPAGQIIFSKVYRNRRSTICLELSYLPSPPQALLCSYLVLLVTLI